MSELEAEKVDRLISIEIICSKVKVSIQSIEVQEESLDLSQRYFFSLLYVYIYIWNKIRF